MKNSALETENGGKTGDDGSLPLERFPALPDVGVIHGFIGRAAGIDVKTGRAEALRRLDDIHRASRRALGMTEKQLATAEQVHGCEIAVLTPGEEVPSAPLTGVDGLVTDRRDVCLGIYVADCCAVYLVDPERRVIALVHSGKKGTDGGIVSRTVQIMRERFGCEPANLVAQLGPCIRPPWYEVDFAAEIVAQCHASGVGRVADAGICTAANPDRYYSYRREKGKTGRMLALLALA